MTFSQRDHEVLATLVHQVQVLSEPQLIAGWWSGDPAALNAVRRCIARLTRLGLLNRYTVMVRPTPLLEKPIWSWRPGDPYPDVAAIAYAVRKRWQAAPVRETVVTATDQAKKLFGGTRRLSLKSVQCSHALGVSQCYLSLRRSIPDLNERWILEPGDLEMSVVPDAVILDGARRSPCVCVDYLGSYSESRLHELASLPFSYAWW